VGFFADPAVKSKHVVVYKYSGRELSVRRWWTVKTHLNIIVIHSPLTRKIVLRYALFSEKRMLAFLSMRKLKKLRISKKGMKLNMMTCYLT